MQYETFFQAQRIKTLRLASGVTQHNPLKSSLKADQPPNRLTMFEKRLQIMKYSGTFKTKSRHIP